MERLTARNENGEKEAYYPYCMREDTCDGDGTSEKCDGCDFAQRVCETLASYEETGLTPEQIREIDRLYAEKCREVAELRQRDIAKEPQYEGDGYHEGDLICDTWICPNCGERYEVEYDIYDFCPKCGQRILRGRD